MIRVVVALALLLAAGCGGESPYELGATRECLEEADVGLTRARPPAGEFPGIDDGLAFNLFLQSRASPPTSGFLYFAKDDEGAKRADTWLDREVDRLSEGQVRVPRDLLRRRRNVIVWFIAPEGLRAVQRELVEGCLTTG